MKSLLFVVLLFPFVALANFCPEGFRYNDCEGPQTHFCTPGCEPIPGYTPDPVPAEQVYFLTFPDGRAPVRFTTLGPFVIAESVLPSGYPVMGFSGPCLTPPCGEIREQAFQSLWLNARQANRAARFQE